MMFKYIKNCRLFNDPKQIVHLAVRNGKIHHKEFICPDDAEIIFNAKGCIAAPGLIDTHVHGCGGANPADGSDRKMSTMAASLCRLGTTSFYATTFFKPDGQNRHLETISQHVSADG